jgi:two-component system, NarL family, nitrate/nitrite response regulator NarL
MKHSRTVRKAVLIDDSEIDLFIQKRFLEVAHFSEELLMYNSANEALSCLKSEQSPPDVIFLDLNMPDEDGFTFLRNFKNLPELITKKSKIVVLTSSESKAEREEVFKFEQVIHFISKPLKNSDIEDLRIILNPDPTGQARP